ncbi:MAG: hypothetical protein ABSG91_06065 [Syntrophobacteraceae bacterium]
MKRRNSLILVSLALERRSGFACLEIRFSKSPKRPAQPLDSIARTKSFPVKSRLKPIKGLRLKVERSCQLVQAAYYNPIISIRHDLRRRVSGKLKLLSPGSLWYY